MPKIRIEDIFDKYRNRVYRLGLSITRNQKDAEDVLQNTFLKIIKNLSTFRNESDISTWIYKIAYNEALMLIRKRRTQFRVSDSLKKGLNKKTLGLFINWAKLPDEQLLDKELKERLDTIVRQMPIKYRMPLLLDNVDELPLKESAKVLGLKTNSLKTRLHRAHLMIKQEISRYFKDEEPSIIKKKRRCGVWTGFVYDYAKGRLGDGSAAAFKNHIKDCRGCQAFLGAYRRAINITGALECQDLPEELTRRIETFIQNRQKE